MALPTLLLHFGFTNPRISQDDELTPVSSYHPRTQPLSRNGTHLLLPLHLDSRANMENETRAQPYGHVNCGTYSNLAGGVPSTTLKDAHLSTRVLRVVIPDGVASAIGLVAMPFFSVSTDSAAKRA